MGRGEAQPLQRLHPSDLPSRRGAPATASSPCSRCSLRTLNICRRLVSEEELPKVCSASREQWQHHETVRASKNIKSVGETLSRVYVMCDGWAFRFAQLPDGRKQILSILIPGDVVTPTGPFDGKVRFSVQALTDARYCGFSASILKARLAAEPHLLNDWAKLLVSERRQNFGLLVDLGSRSADERVAHLILDLNLRLESRNLAVGHSFALPLSQRFIAAATALTPEHVSRVISSFRKAGFIETSRGHIAILNPLALQRIGALNF